jgi:peptidoglycan/LPS O-acetylase OafA/YrhL
MTTSANRTYIPEIDQIRGFAALLVVFYHGLALFSEKMLFGTLFQPKYRLDTINPILAFVYEGHTAVGLFIVLSGFILTIGCVGRPIKYQSFLISRILRIYPLYLFFLFFGMAAHRDQFSLSAFFQSILQLSNLPGAVPAGFLSNMFWAVSVEFQCYLIFPFLLMFANLKGSRFLIGLIAIAVIFRVLLVLEGANARDLSYLTIAGRIDQFCLGIVAARIYVLYDLRRQLRPWSILITGSVVVAALFAFHKAGGWPTTASWKILWPTIEGILWAFFIPTYLVAGQLLPALLAKAATKFGEISYSIYLGHFIILMLMAKSDVFIRATGNAYYDAIITTALVAVPITVAIAALTYTIIESPFLALRKPYVVPQRASEEAPVRAA